MVVGALAVVTQGAEVDGRVGDGGWWKPPAAPASGTAAQQLLEGEPEVLAEESVDAGVERRVAVAQPEEDGEEERGDALGAERPDHVDGEEGQPAHDEASNDDAQRLGGLCLHPEPLYLLRAPSFGVMLVALRC